MKSLRARAKLGSWVSALGHSYWLVPSVMAVASIALAVGVVRLDRGLGSELPDWLSFVYHGGPAGAREILGAIASSTITVVGVVASITVVALSLAAQQQGPRVLNHFMRDLPFKIVLGTFVATFVYSLLVLREVRSEDRSGSFVPHVATTFAIVLAVASIALLTHFVHHVATVLRVEQVVAHISDEVLDVVHDLQQRDPRKIRKEQVDELSARLQREGQILPAKRDGYVQAFDRSRMLNLAVKHDLCVQLVPANGFVLRDEPLMRVLPRSALDESVERELRECLVVGRERTLQQDVRYGIDQLVQVGLRALSPALNDPFTANAVIDQVAAILHRMSATPIQHGHALDERGTLRVVAGFNDWILFLDSAFEAIRHDARDNPKVINHLADTLGRLVSSCRNSEELYQLSALMDRVGVSARSSLQPVDWALFEPHLQAALVQARTWSVDVPEAASASPQES